jgi:hypothetical protein
MVVGDLLTIVLIYAVVGFFALWGLVRLVKWMWR